MCVQESIQPPNAEAAKHVNRVRILMYFQIGVAVLMMIFGFPAINMMIMALLLYMVYDQLSVCGAIFYIFFTLFDTVMYASNIGKTIQNTGGVDKSSGQIMFFITFLILFDIVAIYVVFSAYKEFKASWQEMGGNGLMGGYSGMGMRNQDYEQQSYNGVNNPTRPTEESNKNDFKAFTGKGIALG